MTVILDVAAADYHQDAIADQPTLSASVAHILCQQSPAHARASHPRLNPDFEREEKDAFDLGTAAHALLLEGRDGICVVAADSWRTKDAQAIRDETRAAGRIPLLAKDYDRVIAMVDAANKQLDQHGASPRPFTAGKAEQTLVWDDSGVLCRARLDWLHDDHRTIDDYKTTTSAELGWFSGKGIYNHGYDLKAAFYLRGVKALTGVDAEFRWIAQEKAAPYALSVLTPGPDMLALAEAKVQYAIDLWRGCLLNDDWPAYSRSVATAEMPWWAEAQWLEKTGIGEAA